MSLNDVIGKLKDAKRFTTGDEVEIEFLPTPSALMNKELGGGLAFGRQVLIWGTKSAGKTSFSLQCMAEAQRREKTTAFIDAEGTFDKSWAKRLGVEPKEMLYDNPQSLDEIDKSVTDLLRAGVDMILLDSITAGVPSGKFNKGGEYMGASSNNAMGMKARQTAEVLEGWTLMNEGTLLVLISQTRNQNQGTHWNLSYTNGQSVGFYSSQVISLFAPEGKDNHIQGTVLVGDVEIQQDVARKVNWQIRNNKLGPCWGTGSYDFYFHGNNPGVDIIGELVDAAVLFGVVGKAGSWYSYGDLKLQGREAMIEALRKSEELTREIQGEVSGFF